MSVWSPSQYLKFAGHRLRPAVDLLGRVIIDTPARVYDLGCGTGNTTGMLADRWPDAETTGVDQSAEMLARARTDASDKGIVWLRADLGDFAPPRPADVLFSNAAFQWLDNHERKLPRLMEQLRPGGVLALQMPRNHQQPSHVGMDEAAADTGVTGKFAPVARLRPVANPEVYYDILSPVASEIDIWETAYTHVLEGDNPVVEWTKGTALRPLLAALDDGERAAFLAAYEKRMNAAYPRRADGRTLLSFRRIFIVARR